MTTKQTEMFSLDNLNVFRRPGVKEVKPREKAGYLAGCHVYFENGWIVSIQWGNGNYGSNYDNDGPPKDAVTAEVACYKDDGHRDLVKWGGDEWADTVLAYAPMARVQRILDLCAEDKLLRDFQPPTPPVEQRAFDDWTEESGS